MGIILQNDWRNRFIFAVIILMQVSLLTSRALLSVSLILFLLLTILHKDAFSQFILFSRSPLLILISTLFFVPLISGLWSSNLQAWLDVVRIKLPFFLLPLAFAGNWQLSAKQWKIIACSFLLLTAMACLASLWQYFQDIESINRSYLKAKTLPTALKNDHVRFSWLVSIAVISGVFLMYSVTSKVIRAGIMLAILFFIVYLHILSARTGLICVYFFFLCFSLYLAARRRKYFLIVLAGLIIVPITSWWIFPTLRNRVNYVVYDFSFLKNGHNSPGTSDADRLISLRAGWDILYKNPFGVGAGDVRDETNKWYGANVRSIAEADKLFPSSDWIVYGDMAGWPGILLFATVMIFPLFIKRIRHRFFWVMLVSTAIGSSLVETTLETQFGIFIYCFTILWWWKWFDP